MLGIKPRLILYVILSFYGTCLPCISNVYVSTTGNENNNGSINSPFLSIQQAINKMSDGDTCFIMKGIYHENITINKNNITITAFGNDDVNIYGTEFVNNWEKYKGNIYRAKIENIQPQFTQLVYNGVLQKMARYPDNIGDNMFSISNESGYAPLKVMPYGKVEFDSPLPGKENVWAGGYFRAISAKAGATNPTGIISSSNGNTIKCDKISKIWTLTSEGHQRWKTIGPGKGYIFSLNALSREGEWYYQNNYIYFWKPGGSIPKNNEVEVQKWDYVCSADNVKNINLHNLNIRFAAIFFSKSDNITIDGCSFRDIKGWFYTNSYGVSYTKLGGVYINGQNIDIKNCEFNGSWGNLLCLYNSNIINIDNCIFENNGWMGLFTSCIQSNSDNLTVTNSTFGSTGRFHIRSDGNHKLIVKHNDFFDCTKMCQDAGSIELTNTTAMDMKGSVFAYNKFHNMNTLPAWTKNTQFVAALYFEGAKNYTVHHNLFYDITNSRKGGTFVYLGPRYCDLSNCYYFNNTIWNVDFGFKIWNTKNKETGKYGTLNDILVYNNIFSSSTENYYGTPSLEKDITMKNNARYNMSDSAKIFTNTAQNNFTLKKDSPAIGKGMQIKGITNTKDGKRPSLGCYEYGEIPWKCGATLKRK